MQSPNPLTPTSRTPEPSNDPLAEAVLRGVSFSYFRLFRFSEFLSDFDIRISNFQRRGRTSTCRRNQTIHRRVGSELPWMMQNNNPPTLKAWNPSGAATHVCKGTVF